MFTDCENERQAYAELKYYILHYLYYAKKHYQDIYKGNKEISDEKVSDRVNEVKSMEETEAFNGLDKNYNNELFISFKIRR